MAIQEKKIMTVPAHTAKKLLNGIFINQLFRLLYISLGNKIDQGNSVIIVIGI